MDKLHEESRKRFEYEAGKALRLPTSIIELARMGDGYDHAFDSMSIMQPLNGWWHWWQASRASIVVDIPNELRIETIVDKKVQQAFVNGHLLGRKECFDAIRSIGLSIKGE